MKNKYINIAEKRTIILSEEEAYQDNLGPEEIEGSTVYTMISSGTEIHFGYLDVFNGGFPKRTGYTVVFRVENKGSAVKDIEIGDLVFCMAPHQSYVRTNYKDVVKIPENVSPQSALFIRMAGVSMATLSRTNVKPGDNVLVTGLGTVGMMAMLVYSNIGYHVIGVDPDEDRRQTAMAMGFKEIFERSPLDNEKYAKKIGLALECSGNEAAVLDCCNMVRPHGEVSIVGVPWKKCTDISSHEVLHSVFYNYVRLYSGWEMDLPLNTSGFIHESMNKNYELALKLIADGRINVDELYVVKPYTQAQQAYEDILNKKEKKLSTILDWK